MSDKAKPMPMRKAMEYTRRGLALWWKESPELLVSAGVQKAVQALSPYLPLYFTARLVNAIIGGTESPWLLLAGLLVSTAAVAVLRAAVSKWKDTLTQSKETAAMYHIYFEKMLSMDFQSVDDTKTQVLFDSIRQLDNWMGHGLRQLIRSCGDGIGAAFGILGAISLSVSLFTLPVPAGSPLAWLNSPFCLLGVFGWMLMTVLAAPALANRANSYWTRFDGKLLNRLFYAATFQFIDERNRNADARIYRQDRYLAHFVEQMQKGEESWGKNSFMARMARGPMGGYAAGSAAISQGFVGGIYLFAGLKALGGAFSAGSVTQYVGALAGLAAGISSLLETVGELRVNAACLEQVFQFLDIPNRMYQGSLTTEKRADRKYEIEFRNVSFRYPGTENWALRNVNLKFRIGERLAVVGENGSGKTTFIKLLCRLYDPDEGEILLNRIDIRKYQYPEYLKLFSVVFQDFRLLAQGLGKNVAASEEYDRARAEECLRKAGFGARLDELPKGLDTCLYRDFEEDGVEISGGEAQKIALARVLYQDAPFIVLDEPTAALDPEAEAEVYTRFNDIIEDKTAIYISHRLSSCRFCDQIAVFDSGRIVQMGTHEALLEAGGKYRSLWDAQAQYYRTHPPEEADL